MYYIYKMIHKATGRVYIGQRKCPKGKTPETDTAYNGSGKIWRAIWRKHMDECCKVILDIATSKTAIDDLERKYISHYKGVMGDYCVNIAPGGEGVGSGDEHPWFGKHRPEDTKRKLSNALKGEKNHFFGKHHSDDTRRKLSEAQKGNTPWNKGKQLSEEHRSKVSEAIKGRVSPMKGRHLSDEAKRKVSEARKRYWEKKRLDKDISKV